MQGSAMRSEPAVALVGRTVKSIRTTLGWTQHELADRAGMSQAMVSAIENGRVRDLTFSRAEGLLAAMGARLSTTVDAPFLGDRQRQREPAHARASTYVAARLRRAGWEVATEVEIGGDRSRGWIDVLAFHPVTRWLLVIEIKTEIHDLGQIERSLGWFEREGRWAARRLGWYPSRTISCLLLLATAANEARVVANRASFAAGFPVRARGLAGVVDGGLEPGLSGRAVALIDPLSKRAAWLRPLRLDGRRTAAPYADYADFMRAVGARALRRRAT
jgi:transcriptional regulator with XRE-family HTH domain